MRCSAAAARQDGETKPVGEERKRHSTELCKESVKTHASAAQKTQRGAVKKMSMGSNPEDLQCKRNGLKDEHGQQSRRLAALRKECKTATHSLAFGGESKDGYTTRGMCKQVQDKERTGTQPEECEMLVSKEWKRQMQR